MSANGAASLYRAGAGLGLAIVVGARARHRHGLVEAGQCAAQPDRRDLLSDAEIGADPGDRDLARLRRRLEDPADLPRLHAAGHASAPSTARARASRRWCGRRAAWAPAGCACCGTWWCRARMPELLNGIRTALALSFILLVSSELIVAQKGFGYLIGFLGANGAYDAMYRGGADGGVARLRRRPGLSDVDASGCCNGANRRRPADRRPRSTARCGPRALLRAVLGVPARLLDRAAARRLGGLGAQRHCHAVPAAGARAPSSRASGATPSRRLWHQYGADALSRAGRLPDLARSAASCSAWRCRAAGSPTGSSIRSSRSAFRCRRSRSCRS